jgi:hypothetical protein
MTNASRINRSRRIPITYQISAVQACPSARKSLKKFTAAWRLLNGPGFPGVMDRVSVSVRGGVMVRVTVSVRSVDSDDVTVRVGELGDLLSDFRVRSCDGDVEFV